jgi:hypothetical protein
MAKEPWAADFIKGKGHGLIFLLHGRPGVGKTCTAGDFCLRCRLTALRQFSDYCWAIRMHRGVHKTTLDGLDVQRHRNSTIRD